MKKIHMVIMNRCGKECSRHNTSISSGVNASAKKYEILLAAGCATHWYTELNLSTTLISSSPHGAGIIRQEVPEILGIYCLILGGRISWVDQRFAIRFMKLVEHELPLPPLEIASRPLLYCVLYKMAEGMREKEWEAMVWQALHETKGMGVAVLRSLCLR